MSFLFKNSLKVSFGKQFLKVYCQQGQPLQKQNLKTINVILSSHKQNPDTPQYNDSSVAPKKKKEMLKITLIQNHNVTVTELEDAKNLAKRRAMHLVKVDDLDPKSQRPVYKLLTAAEIIDYELSEKQQSDKKTIPSGKTTVSASKKSEKSLNISARIAEHDLSSRLKNISKWLIKQHEVRILIQGSSAQDLGNCDKIFKTIEESVKTPQAIGKIVQKYSKGNMIKFCIMPLTPAINDTSAANTQ